MLTFVMDLGEVPQLEVDQACEEREAALDRKLKDWERKLVKAYLTNHKLMFSPEMHPGPTILGPPPLGRHRT